MSRYSPLADHLADLDADRWHPTTHELERILGADLPRGAERAAWWTDPDSSHAEEWREAGWVVDADHLNLTTGIIAFKRVAGSRDSRLPAHRERRAADDVFDHETGASTFGRVATGGAVAAGLVGLALGVGVMAVRGLVDRRR